MKLSKDGTKYVPYVPKAIPKGLRLVHNFKPGDPDRAVGAGGFRIWFERAIGGTRRLVCRCGWAPHLGRHYDADAWGQKRKR